MKVFEFFPLIPAETLVFFYFKQAHSNNVKNQKQFQLFLLIHFCQSISHSTNSFVENTQEFCKIFD